MTLVIYTYIYIYISDKTDKSYYIVYVTHPQRPKIVPRLWFWSPFRKPEIQHFTEVWCNCLSQGPRESVQRWLDASPYWGAEGCVGQWEWHLGVGCFLDHFVVAFLVFFWNRQNTGKTGQCFVCEKWQWLALKTGATMQPWKHHLFLVILCLAGSSRSSAQMVKETEV